MFVDRFYSLKKSLMVLADEKKGSPLLYDLIEVSLLYFYFCNRSLLATANLKVYICVKFFPRRLAHSHLVPSFQAYQDSPVVLRVWNGGWLIRIQRDF